MIQTNNVHLQFADYFKDKEMLPYFYLLSKKLAEGSVCVDLNQIDWGKLKEEEAVLTQFKLISTEDLKKNKFVSEDEKVKKPLILANNRLYLQRYYQYESLVLQKIKALIENGKENETAEKLSAIKSEVQKLFETNSTGNTDWQAVSAISSVLNRFSIITGGPGTGKTTTLAKVLSLRFKLNPEMKVALAAPTGKAAARMAESLKNAADNFPDLKTEFEQLIPSTLHRLLGYQKNSIYFKHHSENPLPYDLVIVDESSMIDLALFAKLLDAVGKGTHLILLGDKNQLAAVEAGSLFGDLCMTQQELNLFSREKADFINGFLIDESSKINAENISESQHPLFEKVVELQHSFRFSDDGGIGKLSKAIISNQPDEIRSFFENKDEQVLTDTGYADKIFNDFAANYAEYIQENDIKTALEKLNNQRILCAVREGDKGVYALNRKIEKYLHGKGLISPGSEFYENRPLMVTGNNYELGLFNGDIGIVREGRVWFESADGSLKSVLPAFLENVETVFAMTIHKSQGSEFSRVLTVLPENPDLALLTAELLYTAVTRAKNQIIIQGSEEILLLCAGRRVERSSGIADRF